MYQKEGKEEFYRTLLQLSVGLTNADDIRHRMRLMGFEAPANLSRNDVRDVTAKVLRIMRGLLMKENRPDFIATDMLYGDEPHRVMEVMIEPRPWGAVYTGRMVRFFRGKPHFVYAKANWNDGTYQFTFGKWFAGGRTYGAFCYVASWE